MEHNPACQAWTDQKRRNCWSLEDTGKLQRPDFPPATGALQETGGVGEPLEWKAIESQSRHMIISVLECEDEDTEELPDKELKNNNYVFQKQ